MRRTSTISSSRDSTRESRVREPLAGAKQLTGRYHAWESLAMRYLGTLSPGRIKTEDNSFNRLIRPCVRIDPVGFRADEQVHWVHG